MENKKILELRRELELLDTEKLEAILHDAVHKEPADGEIVRLILRILEERDNDYVLSIDTAIDTAWERYQNNIEKQKTSRVISWALPLRVASIIAVVGLVLLAIPQKADASSFLQRMIRWTDSIFELFSPYEQMTKYPKYVFKTDHPGLQQVYDAVVELGITVPVVPMWLPEECELIECKVTTTPKKTYIMARFTWRGNSIILEYDILSDMVSTVYQKSYPDIEIMEIAEVKHSIMQNDTMFVVIWERDNIECFIQGEIQEDILLKVVRSIYTKEEE